MLSSSYECVHCGATHTWAEVGLHEKNCRENPANECSYCRSRFSGTLDSPARDRCCAHEARCGSNPRNVQLDKYFSQDGMRWNEEAVRRRLSQRTFENLYRKQFCCNHCYCYVLGANISAHEKNCRENPRNACRHCGEKHNGDEMRPSKIRRQQHERICTLNPDVSAKCQFCSLEFANTSSATGSARVSEHENVCQYNPGARCQFCGKQMRPHSGLKLAEAMAAHHRICRSNPRNYDRCRHCEKVFVNTLKNSARQQRRAHEKACCDNPVHRCRYCGMQFGASPQRSAAARRAAHENSCPSAPLSAYHHGASVTPTASMVSSPRDWFCSTEHQSNSPMRCVDRRNGRQVSKGKRQVTGSSGAASSGSCSSFSEDCSECEEARRASRRSKQRSYTPRADWSHDGRCLCPQCSGGATAEHSDFCYGGAQQPPQTFDMMYGWQQHGQDWRDSYYRYAMYVRECDDCYNAQFHAAVSGDDRSVFDIFFHGRPTGRPRNVNTGRMPGTAVGEAQPAATSAVPQPAAVVADESMTPRALTDREERPWSPERIALAEIAAIRAKLEFFSGDALRSELRRLQLQWHPDKNVSDPEREAVASHVFPVVQGIWQQNFGKS